MRVIELALTPKKKLTPTTSSMFLESLYFLFDGLTTHAVTGYKHENLLCPSFPRMTHAVT